MQQFLKVIKLVLALSLFGAATISWADSNGEEISASVKALQWRGAYQSQKLSLDKKLGGRVPEGFKAGLTSCASQQQFHSDRAIMGVLLPGANLDSTQAVNLTHFKRGMIEVELAFRLKQPIKHAVADVASLKKLVADVAPAAELPDLGFKSIGMPSVFEIVRANAAAHSFVVGEPVAIGSVDIDAITVGLHHNDQIVFSAQSNSLASGGQWPMLLELINDRVAQGWVIYPDQWLLTGALGQMLPLQAGRYYASFGELGVLSLLVEANAPIEPLSDVDY
jgi:2-keto-4-pentenoate hydratase